MAAAILQGVPATTLDTDIWVELPERRYTRLLGLCVRQGGAVLARTLCALADGSLVNFLFSVHGLRGFAAEYTRAHVVQWNGMPVKVLPLQRILKSKQTIRREKDLAHIPLIKRVLQAQRHSANAGRSGV
jgi:hypothetical protein